MQRGRYKTRFAYLVDEFTRRTFVLVQPRQLTATNLGWLHNAQIGGVHAPEVIMLGEWIASARPLPLTVAAFIKYNAAATRDKPDVRCVQQIISVIMLLLGFAHCLFSSFIR
jgi:hypothetical protein